MKLLHTRSLTLLLAVVLLSLTACLNRREWLAQKWILTDYEGDYSLGQAQQDSLQQGVYYLHFKQTERFTAHLPHGDYSGKWVFSDDSYNLQLLHDPGQSEPLGFGLDELGPDELKMGQYTREAHSTLYFEAVEEQAAPDSTTAEE